MKTFTASAFVAALLAALILPVRLEVTGAVMAVGAILGLAGYDYSRQPLLRLAAPRGKRAARAAGCGRCVALPCEQHRLAA